MKKLLLMSCLIATLFFRCTPGNDDNVKAQGYVPVYRSALSAHQVFTAPVRATVNAGKIYAYNNYLFQVEEGEGIHIIDNSVPQQAAKMAFLEIPQCTEIAIKSNHLYANNINDLVVFDLSNITSPVLVKRLENAFPAVNQEFPPFSNVYFQCPDPSKGLVVGWQLKTIENPQCRR